MSRRPALRPRPGQTSDGLERSRDIRERILVVVVGGLPILFWMGTYSRFDVPKLVLLTVGVCAVAGIALWFGFEWRKAWGRLAVPILAIVGPLAIAAVVSPYRGWFSTFGDYQWFQGLVPYALFAALAFFVAGTFRSRRSIAAPIVFAGAVVGAYATLQRVGVDFVDWAQGFSGSTIGNPNFVSGYLSIALPLAVIGAMQRWWGPWSIAAVVAIVAGLFAANSLGGFVATAVAAVVMGALSQRSRPFLGRIVVAVPVLAAVAIVAAGLFVVAPNVEGRPNSVEQRALWWRGSIEMFTDHPIAGRGPDSYAVEGVRYRSPQEAVAFPKLAPNDPHSVFFDFLTAGGVLMGAGFLVLCGWVLMRIARITPGEDLLLAAFGAAAAAYLTQSFVSIDELSIRSGFWAVAGALVLVEEKQARKGKKPHGRTTPVPPTPPAFVRAIGAGVILLGIVGGSIMWWADAQVHDATRSAAQDAEEGLRSTIGVWPLLDYKRGLANLLAEQEKSSETEDEELQREVDDAFAYLDRYPIPVDMLLYAQRLQERRDIEGARGLLRRALDVDPHNPLIAEALDGLETP